MVLGTLDNPHPELPWQRWRLAYLFAKLTNRLHKDCKPVSGGETTRVVELSRLGRKGNPGKLDNFSSYKPIGSTSQDNF